MRRKRNARILFWPTWAAIAIILVLMGSSQWKRWAGAELTNGDRLESGRLESGLRTVSADPFQDRANIFPPPRPLSASDPETSRIAVDLAGPDDSRGAETMRTSQVAVDTSAMLAIPESASGSSAFGVTLLAPVRNDEEELAGLANLNRPSEFEAIGTKVSTTIPRAENWNSDVDRTDSFGAEREDGFELRISDSEEWSVSDAAGIAPLEISPPISQQDEMAGRSRIEPTRSGVAWPRTPALDESLAELQTEDGSLHNQQVLSWIPQVREALLALQAVPSITDPRAGVLIKRLGELAELGISLGEQQDNDRHYQQRLLRVAHSLLRRTIVWNAVWEVGDQENGQLVSVRVRDSESLVPTVAQLRERAGQTGDPDGWVRYLLLDEIESATKTPNAELRRILAQRILSRVEWTGLSDAHREWLDHSTLELLTKRIRPWADAPVDYANLLAQLERQESDAVDLGGIAVAEAVQNLRFSDSERTATVATTINDYYRNANLRMAVSVDLLNQLLPDVPSRTTPIRQTIVGLPVRGTGVVQSDLGLQLVPAEGAWNLLLNTDGSIDGRTGSSQWPVRVLNRSQTQFAAATPIRIDQKKLTIGDTSVEVRSKIGLQKMTSRFDGFPVIESLVRAIAMAKYEKTAPLAKRESEGIMRREIAEQISGDVEAEIRRASDQLANRLLGPLGRLQLDPLVVDLDTSESRLTARYRIAGDWQLAAFTPRPRALTDSVLSVQVHQSLLNNTFEQLLLGDSPQPIRQMMARVLEMFGVDQSLLPGELPADAQIQFASTRPVTVEIEDGLLWLTLRVVSLTDSQGLNLSHFIVRSSYRAEFDGLNAKLVREGVLRISGPGLGFRERLPVRAIFTKVLDDDRPLMLVNEELATHPAAQGLKVGMLDLVDGWLCLAICRDATKVAIDSRGEGSASTIQR